MESLTKPKATFEQLQAIAAKHLGAPCQEAKELTDGWFNAAFMLSQPDGRQFVLKIAPPKDAPLLRYEANILAVEVEAMRMVAAKTNLPIPHIVVHDVDCLEVSSEYFIMEKLSGVPFNHVRDAMDDETQATVYRQVGAHLRTLHSLTNPTFGLYDNPSYSTWPDAFQGLYEDLERDGKDRAIPLPEGAFKAGEKLFDALTAIKTPSFVHWDLWEGNVFVDQASITGLIDFERALWGDPLMEVNFWSARPATIEGYGKDLFAEPGATERRMLYDLYFYLVMVIESTYRGFTAEHEAWPRGMLDELLTKLR